jgi:hypothetical protein
LTREIYNSGNEYDHDELVRLDNLFLFIFFIFFLVGPSLGLNLSLVKLNLKVNKSEIKEFKQKL